MFGENDIVFDDGSVEIPQPDYPDETPAEAFLEIVKDTIVLAKEMGNMTDDEVNVVLETLLNERLAEARKGFKVHFRDK